MKTALFPGTFRPFTIGHADIVNRALSIFDRVIISIGINCEKADSESDVSARQQAISQAFANEPRVSVMTHRGLTVDVAREVGANVILRSVRSVKDYEYERDMADANRALSGIETVILIARPELAFISSSLVRELQAYGHDVSKFLPNDNL